MKDPNQNPNAMKWLFYFAKSGKGNYILSVILALSGVACLLVIYHEVAHVITNLVDGNKDRTFYLSTCGLIGALWILRHLLHACSTSVSHKTTFQVLGSIRMAILKKLATMPLGTVQEKSSGAYKSTICERVDSIETTLAHILPEFTANICGSIAFFIYLMIIDWRIGLWSLITLPIGLTLFAAMMSTSPKYYPRTVEKTKALNATAVEYINGIEVIKSFGRSKTSYGKFVTAAKEGAACYIDWMRACIFYQSFCMAIIPATLVSVLPAGVFYTMNHSLSADRFIFAIILSFGIMSPLLTVFSYMDDLAQIPVIMSDVANILDQKDMLRPDHAQALPRDAKITLRHVKFSYREQEVLHGIDLQIPSGSVCALVGPSGSGKTTIARLITALWDVDEGSILIGDVDIRSLPIADFNDLISYVSQDNYLFDLSVMDNIRLGKPDATDEEVITAAKQCGCHDFICSLSEGYATRCGGSGGHLSGGERQRIAIARAMLKNTPIVVFDEATSYTDPESETVIQTAIGKLIQGKTVLMIAHRLSTIAHCDRIFVVNQGQIEDFGTQEELLDRCSLYRSMWETHIRSKDTEEISLTSVENSSDSKKSSNMEGSL